MNSESDYEHGPSISTSHTQHEKHIRTKHTIKNPSFFDIDKTSNDYITNHNRKYSFFPIKCDFILIFNKYFSNLIYRIGVDKIEIKTNVSSPSYTCKTRNDEMTYELFILSKQIFIIIIFLLV